MEYQPQDAKQQKQQIESQMKVLRQKILKFFPEMEAEVLKMNRNDLIEILQLAENTDNDQRVEIAKQKMIEEILQIFPDMEKEISVLDQKDIQEIYEQIVDKSDPVVKKEEIIGFMSTPPVVKAQPKPRNPIIRGPDGELNVYEMKKTLTERLPEFRNQIRNLPDEEIRTMFKQLQEQQKRRRQSERNLIHPINQAPRSNYSGGNQMQYGYGYAPMQYNHNAFYPNYQNIKSIPVASGYRGQNPHPHAKPHPNSYPTPYPYVFYQDNYNNNYGFEYQKTYITPDQKQQVSYFPKPQIKQKPQIKSLKPETKQIQSDFNFNNVRINFNNGLVAKIKLCLEKQDFQDQGKYTNQMKSLVEIFSGNPLYQVEHT